MSSVFHVPLSARHTETVGDWTYNPETLLLHREAEPEVTQTPKITREVLMVYLERLPPEEADWVDLCLVRGKTRSDVATIWGMSQAAVTFRLHKAFTRIRFMIEFGDAFTTEDVERDFRHLEHRTASKKYNGTVPIGSTDVLATFWRVTGVAETARQLHVTWSFVRYRLRALFKRFIPALVVRDPRYERYWRGLSYFFGDDGHWNIMRACTGRPRGRVTRRPRPNPTRFAREPPGS